MEPHEHTSTGSSADSGHDADKGSKESGDSPGSAAPWLRGAMISGVGVLGGSLAFALFCYALGLNFSDEGWSQNRSVDRVLLVTSLVGLAVAILIFWLGFIRTTQPRS